MIQNGIAFQPQILVCNKFLVDALLKDAPVIVQIDGDYWHGKPEKYPNPDRRQRKRMALDKSQDAYLAKCGFRVVRVWGSELQHDPAILITRIQQALGQAQIPQVAFSPSAEFRQLALF